MKFQEYLNKKNLQQESEKTSVEPINEFSGTEATEVNFGAFSWGGGGEIDAMAAAAGAAALLAAKSLYNGIVYAKLKSELPNYIKEYKLTQAPKSNIVWKEGKQGEKIREIEKQIAALTGKGGERENDREAGTGEKSAKQKADAALQPAIDKAEGERKAQLKDKLDKIHQQIDIKVEQLREKKQAAEDKLDADWDKAKEKFRQYEEKFKEKEDGFLEVRDSPLASAFRKKWEREFQVAKNEANIEVLEEAQQLARDNNMKRELDAITGALERAKAASAEAEEKMNQVLDDADKAEALEAQAGELGVQDMMASGMAYDQTMGELGQKYQKKAEDITGGGRDKEAELKLKIQKAEAKLKKGKEALGKIKDSGDQEKAAKVEDALKKIESDIASYKEELNKVRESLSMAEYFTLAIQLDEAIEMLDALFEEEEEKKKLNFSDVKDNMLRAIANAPKGTAEKVASECLQDVNTLKGLAEEYVKSRNAAVEKIAKAKEDGKDIPKELEGFSKITPLDDKKFTEKFDNAIKDLEERGAKAEDKDNQQSNDQEAQQSQDTEETTPEETKPAKSEESEEVKKLKQDIADQEDRIENIKKKAKDPKSPLSNKDVLKKALESEETKLKELNQELEEAQRKKQEESIKTSLTPKYMKFEDFLALKEKR